MEVREVGRGLSRLKERKKREREKEKESSRSNQPLTHTSSATNGERRMTLRIFEDD